MFQGMNFLKIDMCRNTSRTPSFSTIYIQLKFTFPLNVSLKLNRFKKQNKKAIYRLINHQ